MPPPMPGESYPPSPPVPRAYPAVPPPIHPPVVLPQATPGKGTRGWLYGCLGLLAVGGIIAVLGGVWVFKKAKGIAENPEQFIAEMAVKANPDLELISVDKTAGEVVIKDKKSGESTTFSFDEVKNGKIGLKKSDGSTAQLGPDGIRMKDKDGTESVMGGGANVPLPAWVPPYPGASKVMMSSQKRKGLNQTGHTSFLTSDPPGRATAAYRGALEEGGFEVTEETATADGIEVVSMQGIASLEGGGREQIDVRFFAQGKETMIHLDYSHEEPEAGQTVEK